MIPALGPGLSTEEAMGRLSRKKNREISTWKHTLNVTKFLRNASETVFWVTLTAIAWTLYHVFLPTLPPAK